MSQWSRGRRMVAVRVMSVVPGWCEQGGYTGGYYPDPPTMRPQCVRTLLPTHSSPCWASGARSAGSRVLLGQSGLPGATSLRVWSQGGILQGYRPGPEGGDHARPVARTPNTPPITAELTSFYCKVSQNGRVSPEKCQKAYHSPCFQNRLQKSPLDFLRFPYFRAFSHKELMGHFDVHLGLYCQNDEVSPGCTHRGPGNGQERCQNGAKQCQTVPNSA